MYSSCGEIQHFRLWFKTFKQNGLPMKESYQQIYVKPFKIRKYPKLSKSPSSNIIFKLYSPIWPYVPCLKPALNDGCHPSTNIDTENHYFLEECTFSIFFKPQVMAGSWYFWGQIHNSTIIIHESMMWDVFPHGPFDDTSMGKSLRPSPLSKPKKPWWM